MNSAKTFILIAAMTALSSCEAAPPFVERALQMAAEAMQQQRMVGGGG